MKSAAMQVGPLIVMGVSGCGKTTIGQALAEHFKVPYIEGDTLHPIENVEKMRGGTPLADEDRWPWLSEIGRQLAQRSSGRSGAVATCSALKKAYRERLRAGAGQELRFVFLKCSKKELEARMAARVGHFMPASLLASQLATLEDPGGEAGTITVDGDGPHERIIEEVVRLIEAGL